MATKKRAALTERRVHKLATAATRAVGKLADSIEECGLTDEAAKLTAGVAQAMISSLAARLKKGVKSAGG